MITTITKQFGPFPFAHRQPIHDGHCRFLHGHNWVFEIEFGATSRDENSFIADFGKMDYIKTPLTQLFDHTVVISDSDPDKETFFALNRQGLLKLFILSDVSCEGLAEFIFQMVGKRVLEAEGNRVWVESVTVYEDEKNSATRRRA